VPGERRVRLLARLTEEGAELDTKRLCDVCAEVTGMNGAGIMLMSGDVAQGSLCTTDDVSALIEELQFSLGEGPCVDAHNEGQPVLEPDLADPERPRWLAFAGPAVDAGVRAVFGFPLRLGHVRLGALDVYRTTPGPMTDDEHADALAMADIATQAVLSMQADAPPGQLAVELQEGAEFRYVVHQASGMVAAQLEVSVGQALIRLRAHAFGNGRPLMQVARDVVARRLRFDDSNGQDGIGR
jgi:GAF domain-containing protein